MEKILKNSNFASDRSFSQFLEFEQKFCLGRFGNISWDLYLPYYILKPLLAICPEHFARMTALHMMSSTLHGTSK